MLSWLTHPVRFLVVWLIPPKVVGSEQYGWSAKYPWDRNWCWASSRDTVMFGARERAMGR